MGWHKSSLAEATVATPGLQTFCGFHTLKPAHQSLVWGALGALGLWLGFPNAVYHMPFMVLLYPWALVLLAEQAHNGVQALRHGWLTGLVGASAALYWLTIPIEQVGGLPLALAIPCAMGMGAYVGLYGGLFSLGAFYAKRYMPNSPIRYALILACLWYGLELLRNVAFTGFPWLTLSAAFAPYPYLIQGASVLGAYALSAVYVLFVLSLRAGLQASLPRMTRTQRGISLGVALGIAVSIAAYGAYALSPSQSTVDKNSAFSVIMVEGNIDQNIKWEPELQQATLQTYMDLSRTALQSLRKENTKAQALLVWPETAMPFFLEYHPILGRRLLHFVQDIQSPLLLGAPAMNKDPLGQNRPFNRAYSVDSSGALWGTYDKVHLVPFGEYVPSWLQWNFLEGLLQSIGAFSAGSQENPVKNSVLVDKERTLSLALGALICYEGIFPELAQRRVALGANVLVNISNDGWFGDSSAPLQHLQLTLMRAVEQGRWLIRNTNTGISAIIDPQGRIRLQGAQFKAQSLTGIAHIRHEKTLFHALYGALPWLILGLGIFLLGSVFIQRKSS